MSHAEYLEKTVLVGADYLDENDEVVERRQFVGVIKEIDEEKGILLQLRNGTTFLLPPFLNALQPAEPGDYTLQTTLEIVRDPDFLAVWRLRGEVGS